VNRPPSMASLCLFIVLIFYSADMAICSVFEIGRPVEIGNQPASSQHRATGALGRDVVSLMPRNVVIVIIVVNDYICQIFDNIVSSSL
jgi:hypothetical protein